MRASMLRGGARKPVTRPSRAKLRDMELGAAIGADGMDLQPGRLRRVSAVDVGV